MRRDIIGYVFQKFYLIPLLSAFENVDTRSSSSTKKRDTTGRAAEYLRAVGIDPDMGAHRPNQLSGGQQQRVAIARALVNDPKILLCDEPTGNLDSKTGLQIMEILCDLHRKGKTVIIVTHDPEDRGVRRSARSGLRTGGSWNHEGYLLRSLGQECQAEFPAIASRLYRDCDWGCCHLIDGDAGDQYAALGKGPALGKC